MIGGNKDLILKIKNGKQVNSIGEWIPQYTEYFTLHGFIDLSNENTKYTTFNSKVQESDYIFICDYVELPLHNGSRPKTSELTAELGGNKYDVLLIDNVMELNKHYEIYLRYVGE